LALSGREKTFRINKLQRNNLRVIRLVYLATFQM
jgi:hypothetical protein